MGRMVRCVRITRPFEAGFQVYIWRANLAEVMESGEVSELSVVTGACKILRFALPSVIMMLFISSFNVVDGLFISNFIDTDGLAALNILMPLFSLLTGVGFMLATGGSAYVSNRLGRGEPEKARAAFSLIMVFGALFALISSVLALIFMDGLVRLLGADDSIAGLTAEYGSVYACFCVFVILQFLCNQFLVVTGKPTYALVFSLVGGLLNVVLDYVFIVLMGFGMTGAAVASGLGSAVPCIAGLAVFCSRRSDVRFTIPSKDMSVLKDTCSNGISEMVGEISGGITTLLFNLVMMEYIGPDGVAAMSILMYVQFLALAALIGYSNGVAPLMSYRHGADDKEHMWELFRISMTFVMGVSIAIFAVMELFAGPIVSVFASDSDSVMSITTHGAMVFSFAFLLMGGNMYSSSLFTSLSNGRVSAIISFVRTLVLLAPFIVILPMVFGIDAIWYAVPLTELLTFMLSAWFINSLGHRYGFLPERSARSGGD